MEFLEWKRAKEKEEEEKKSSSSTTTTKSSSASSLSSSKESSGADDSTGSSFIDWVRKKKAERSSDSLQNWYGSGRSLLNEVNQYYSVPKWGGGDSDYYSDFQSRASDLLASADSWRKQYTGNEKALSSIDSMVSALSDMKQGAMRTQDYYSRWESQDDYKKWSVDWLNTEGETSAEKVKGRKDIYESNKARIAEIDKEIQELGYMQKYATTADGIPLPVKIRDGSDKEKKHNALVAEKEKLEAENRQYDNTQGEMDKYYDIPLQGDFDAVSKHRNFDNASVEELRIWDNKRSGGVGSSDLRRTVDSNGNSIIVDSEGNVYDKEGNTEAQPEIQDKLGFYLSTDEEERNEIHAAKSLSGTYERLLFEGNEGSWDQLKEDEVKIYYYLLNTEGQEAAYKYLSDMTTELNRRSTVEMAKQIDEASGIEKFGYNVASVPANVLGGAIALIEDGSNLLLGKDINPYSDAHALSNMASATRASTAKDLNDWTGNASFLKVTLGDAYQSVMSGIDSFAAGGLFGPTGAGLLLGANAAASEMKRLYEEGASNSQIAWGGILAGAAEMVFEKYSIEKLIDMGDTKTKVQFIKNVLLQGGIEASEEAATEIANTVSDMVIRGGQSDIGQSIQAYMQDGMSQGEATLQALKDVGVEVWKSAAGGFISGGGMGGAVSGVDYATRNLRTGAAINEHEGAADLIAQTVMANKEGYGGAAYEQALKVARNAKKSGFRYDNAVGKLYNMAENALIKDGDASGTKALIKNRLIELGVAESAAELTANGLFKGFIGEKTTRSETAAINGSEAAQQVWKELNDPANTRESQGMSAEEQAMRNAYYSRVDNKRGSFADASVRGVEATRNYETATQSELYRNATDRFDAAQGALRAAAQGNADANAYFLTKQKKSVAVEKATGEKVAMDPAKTVESISEDGKVLYHTNDGVKSSEEITVSPDIQDAIKIGQRNGMTVDEINGMLASYDGEEYGETYAASYALVYNHARLGYGREHSISEAGYLLDSKAANAAYEAGSARRLATLAKASEQKNAVTQKAKEENGGKIAARKGRVIYKAKPETETQKQFDDLANLFAESAGVDVVLYTRKTNPEMNEKSGKHVLYHNGRCEVWIDLEAQNNSEGKWMLSTMAHELVHFMRANAEHEFEVYKNFVIKQVGKARFDWVVGQHIRSKNPSQKEIDTAIEEAVAELSEGMLADGSAIRELAKTDLDTAKTIRDWIRNFLQKVLDAFAGYTGRYQEMIDEAKVDLKTWQKMYNDLLKTAVENYNANSNSQSNNAEMATERYSVDPTFEAAYDNWDKKDPRIVFNIGTTSNVLKSLGVLNKNISWDSSKIIKIKAKHPEMTDAIIKQVPNILESPIIVMQSKQSSTRMTLFGEVYSGKKPILAILELHPTGRGGLQLDELKIASAYGKDKAQALINSSTILYKEPNKKRVSSWEKRTGLQLPVGSFMTYSNDNVPQNGTVVNNDSMPVEEKYSSDNLYSYDRLIAKEPMSIVELAEVDPQKMQTYRANREAFSKAMVKVARRRNHPLNTESATYLYCKDIDRDIMVGRKSFGHGAARIDDTYAAVCMKMGEILENAIAVNELKPRDKTDGSIVLLGMAETEENYVCVRAIINKIKSDLISYDIVYSVKKASIKKEDAGVKPADYRQKTGSTTSSKISIRNFFEIVKKEQLPNSVFSADVLEHLVTDRIVDENITSNLMYSTDILSRREILSDAFLQTAQNAEERLALENYRKASKRAEACETELSEVKRKIKEASFSKGMRDQKWKDRMANLQARKEKLERDLSRLDKALLKTEAAKPLQELLNRERQEATKRAMEKGRERMRNRTENAQKAILRRKMQKTLGELNHLLVHGTKEKNIKAGLQDTVASALALGEVLFNDEISNEDIVRLGVMSVTEKESKLLNEYMDLLEKRDKMQKGIQSMLDHPNPKYKEDLLARESDLAKIKARISRLNTRLSEVFERERNRYNRAQIAEVINGLKDSYGRLKDEKEQYISAAYSSFAYDRLATLANSLSGTAIKDMSLPQLQEVSDAFTMIRTLVKKADQLFQSGRSVEAIGQSVIREVQALKKNRCGLPVLMDKALQKGYGFYWKNLKPVYAMEMIGSEALKDLYWDVINGEGTYYKDISQAKDFIAEKKKRYHYGDWDLKKTKSFTLRSGQTIKLNVLQMLSIHAYAKREQAHAHMFEGGFVFAEGELYRDVKEAVKKEERGKEKGKGIIKLQNTYETYKMDLEALMEIEKALTEEQRAYADEMQQFLSDVMGAKGNEVSRQLYGIDLFKEQHYFPLKSQPDFISSVQEALQKTQHQLSLRNTGMTKETVPDANNPIVLQSFDEVWLEHVNKMSQYHAMVLPIDNFARIFNFKDVEHGTSVKNALNEVFGKAAKDYLDQYISDLNGGLVGGNSQEGFAEEVFGKFKKAQVAASLSTAIQQPTAVLRAMSMIDPQYFAAFLNSNPAKTEKGLKNIYKEMLEYAPIAGIKEMGGFDISSSGNAKKYMGITEREGFKNRVKGLVKDSAYRNAKLDDLFMKLATLGDQAGWLAIWGAVKREIAAQGQYDVGSKAFLEACGDRFTKVIVYTQVYDSVNSRSEAMRKGGFWWKTVTAFMGEPTTSMNMIFNAAIQVTRAPKGQRAAAMAQAARIIGFTYASSLLAEAAASFIYGLRDDDEEDKLEAWLKRMLEDVFSPIELFLMVPNMIPVIRDVISVAQGFTTERNDLVLWADVIQSYKELFDKDKEFSEKILDFSGAIADVFGIPLRNVVRDSKAVYNLFADIFNIYVAEPAVSNFSLGSASENREQINAMLEAGGEKALANLEAQISEGRRSPMSEREKRFEAEKTARSTLKANFTRRYKEEYFQAFQAGDGQKMKEISKILQATGLYESVDETLTEWRKEWYKIK